MNRRERILLIVGSSLIVFLLFYYYIYSPRQAEYRALQAQLQDRQNTLQRMEADARQAPQLEAEFARLQATIAQLESKLPTSKETAVLLVQLENLTRDLGIDLNSIRPANLESPPRPAQPAGAAAQPATATYLRYPIKLTMNADYSELLRLTSRLHTFPRLIVVRRIVISPRVVPDLSAEVDVETFVLPKEAR
ncbi:MAG TPA: type 4a pilus biogenesis protein PilO [bacterium]|nr:type 4a pilus biogenesis protein PilO [bacterium]